MRFAGRIALLAALAGVAPAGAALAAAAKSAAAPAKKEHVVSAHGAAFDPKELVVKPGDTVVWKNDDVVAHTVKASDGSFASRELPPDATFKWVAKKKGKHDYVCTLHMTMKGSITVR